METIKSILDSETFMFIGDYFKAIYTLICKIMFVIFVLINLPLILANLYVKYICDSLILNILFIMSSTILYWFFMMEYIIF